MMLSHHPPCQFNRTYKIGKIRFCFRCTGVLIGFIFFLLINYLLFLNQKYFTLLLVILPLPAVFNFAIHELGKIPNRNIWRLLTGFLLGCAIGIAVKEICNGLWLLGILFFLWLIVIEIIITLILNKAKVLQKFMEEYENGVYK